jgi:hypothetical protein
MKGKQDIDLGELYMVDTFDEANLLSGSLNSEDHNDFVWPIRYSNDYMPTNKASMPPFVDLSLTCCPDLEAKTIGVDSAISTFDVGTEYAIKESERLGMNCIPLFPVHANLPWHCSIHHVKQNMHWQTAVKAARELLKLLASDENATNISKGGGRSYAEMAAEELPMSHDNWIRFSAYMWPAASENRTKLIAETVVYLFILDGKWNYSRNITTLITCGADAWEESDESTVSRSKLLRLHMYNS